MSHNWIDSVDCARASVSVADRGLAWLAAAGVRLVRTPPAAPNGNAHDYRFVGLMKEECLNRIVPLGERHLRRTLQQGIGVNSRPSYVP